MEMSDNDDNDSEDFHDFGFPPVSDTPLQEASVSTLFPPISKTPSSAPSHVLREIPSATSAPFVPPLAASLPNLSQTPSFDFFEDDDDFNEALMEEAIAIAERAESHLPSAGGLP